MFRSPRTILGASLCTTLISILTLSQFAQADVEQEWAEFQNNAPAFMEKQLIKRGMNEQILPNAASLFTREDAETKAFVEKKAQARKGMGRLSSPICDAQGVCLDDVIAGRAKAKENVEDFLDLSEFRAKKVRPTASLEEMEERNLKSAALEETPWSDSYWPISQGVLGARYSESRFTKLGHNWKARFDLLLTPKTSLKEIMANGTQAELDSLSPSEKYDLLIGDLGGTYQAGYLTPSQWEDGQEYFKENGKVESWMGICHGWAPASFMMPRPRKTVSTPSADGTRKVTFFPSDLKGLASYSWAVGDVDSTFLGGRCNEKNPKKDKESGRILDEECFDTNPGNWHVAIVNQIGVAKRSFVIDATYDYEVWNQPVYSYKYKYFNPQTGKEARNLNTAAVAIEDFSNDKFKKFRSKQTKSVIGVSMDVTYVVETAPTADRTDSPSRDAVRSVTYMYDLELNAKGEIIGGEWYTNAHPDFLWLPPASARAESYGDSGLRGSWTPGEALPEFWRDIAVKTATKHGQPLAAIIDPLLAQANK
ncbi:MAG: hypothetical protein EOP05_05350 [Proteobacteria bacterium]|nr:MAG: hypothetical protein EOP05_05350 [Pseudomonadota bacterium]